MFCRLASKNQTLEVTAESEDLMEYENVKAEEILSDTVFNIKTKQKSGKSKVKNVRK